MEGSSLKRRADVEEYGERPLKRRAGSEADLSAVGSSCKTSTSATVKLGKKDINSLPTELMENIVGHLLCDVRLSVRGGYPMLPETMPYQAKSDISNKRQWSTLFAFRAASKHCKAVVDDTLDRAIERNNIAVIVDLRRPRNCAQLFPAPVDSQTPAALADLVLRCRIIKFIVPILAFSNIGMSPVPIVMLLTVTVRRTEPDQSLAKPTFHWQTIRPSAELPGDDFNPVWDVVEQSIAKSLSSPLDVGPYQVPLNWMYWFSCVASRMGPLAGLLPSPLPTWVRFGDDKRTLIAYNVAAFMRKVAIKCAEAARSRLVGQGVDGGD